VYAAENNSGTDATYCRYATQQVQIAQTFTAGITGSLDQVAIWAGRYAPEANVQPLDISIQTVTAAGAPSGTEIGGGTFSGSATGGGPRPMPLSSPATVEAGTKYAIVLAEDGCGPALDNGWTFAAKRATTDEYPGGSTFARSITAAGPGAWNNVNGGVGFSRFRLP
jgi:hypothetical protein